MLQRVMNELKKNAQVSDWLIRLTDTNTSELFYVGKNLEVNRAASVKETEVTIYTDTEKEGVKLRGSATFNAYEYMDEKQLKEKIDENVYSASFAMNPWYPVASPEEKKIPASSSNIASMALKDAAEIVSDAIFDADHYDHGYLSATEIFLTCSKKQIVNSKGVDVTAVSYSGSVELIPSWKEQEEDVEIYHMMRFESLDKETITKKAEEQLALVKARYEAKKLSEIMDLKEGVKVILQDREAGRMFRYFASDLTYASKYTHSNKFELGDNVQGSHVTGTKLNLTMASYVKGALASAAFDSDGVILKDTELVRDGIAMNRYGSCRMGYYVGEEMPSGDLPILVVGAGDKTFGEMSKEKYLRCVTFSGLQVEPNSGYFGGEVRLGFYFDGEKEIPVTGFSISGNFKDAAGSMVYSKETETYDSYQGPKYLEIRGMGIA